MRIAVIGAGVVGISTAYELTRDGHQVTVYEKNTAAAEGSSFANAGLISNGLALPRSIPPQSSGILSAFSKDQDKIRASTRTNFRDWRWLWAWRNAHKHPEFLNKCRELHSLMGYSQARMQGIALDTGLAFERQSGQLLICRHANELHRINTQIKWIKEFGTTVREVSENEVHTIEPALDTRIKLSGAWYFPNDETVNSRQFALLLKNESIRMGTIFHFNTEVVKIAAGESPAVFLKNELSGKDYDAVVVCTGGLTNRMRASLGVMQGLPLAELYGYSLSATIKEPLSAPRGSIIDTSSGGVIARIGNRVRVTNGASLGDFTKYHSNKAIQNLYEALQTFFPSSVGFSSGVQVWKGVQFTTSDGLPYVGLSPAAGIWLNMGHGTNGWGLACGSARVVSDLIRGKDPEVNIHSMKPTRKFK